jgi:hypothetical protein
MKKKVLVLAVISTLSLSACGSTQAQGTSDISTGSSVAAQSEEMVESYSDESVKTQSNQENVNSESTEEQDTIVTADSSDTASSGSSAAGNSASDLPEVTDGSISFRSIPWYSTKSQVEKKLFAEGASEGGFMSNSHDIYRMDATDFQNVTIGSNRVDGGGYMGWYSGISVAGYAVEDTYACYMYPINEDGTLNTNDDDAQLYFGWYTFDSNTYQDLRGIYDDLNAKVSSLYGAGEEAPGDYYTTITWKDAQQNQIRLLINKDENYVTLGYMAADADARLDQVAAALDNAQAAQESQNRQDNANNTSGL